MSCDLWIADSEDDYYVGLPSPISSPKIESEYLGRKVEDYSEQKCPQVQDIQNVLERNPLSYSAVNSSENTSSPVDDLEAMKIHIELDPCSFVEQISSYKIVHKPTINIFQLEFEHRVSNLFSFIFCKDELKGKFLYRFQKSGDYLLKVIDPKENLKQPYLEIKYGDKIDRAEYRFREPIDFCRPS
jgi:hypothetical protein